MVDESAFEYSRIVVDASVWEDMDGETPTIKKLVSLLTCEFILSVDMPADECIDEARHLAALWAEDSSPAFLLKCEDYLVEQFAMTQTWNDVTGEFMDEKHRDDRTAAQCKRVAPKVLEILQGH